MTAAVASVVAVASLWGVVGFASGWQQAAAGVVAYVASCVILGAVIRRPGRRRRLT